MSSKLLALVLVTLCMLVASCATVRPEDKEHLAEPAMTFRSNAITSGHEQHVLDNREGGRGGDTTRGGGCGCN